MEDKELKEFTEAIEKRMEDFVEFMEENREKGTPFYSVMFYVCKKSKDLTHASIFGGLHTYDIVGRLESEKRHILDMHKRKIEDKADKVDN